MEILSNTKLRRFRLPQNPQGVLAYIAIAVGLVLLFCPPNNFNREVKLKVIIYRGIAYALGGVSVVFLTMIPYLILRQEQIWFSGVITASLSYSSVQKSLFAALSEPKNQLGFSPQLPSPPLPKKKQQLT